MRAIRLGDSFDRGPFGLFGRRAAWLVAAAAAWAVACGENATAPSPTPPAPRDPPRPASVTVAPASIEFEALADTVRLTAEVRDQNGQAMSGVRVVWTSGLAQVASVSAIGMVTAVGNGTTTITAAAGSASGQATATVAQRPAAVTVTPASLSFVSVGDTARLAAAVADANGHAIDGMAVSWSSSDAGVATVDGTGLVRARSVGAAAVAAEWEDLRGLAWVSVSSGNPGDHHAALIAGVPERPFVNTTVGGQEGSVRTVGTLRMGLNPDQFPVIVSQGDMGPAVLVAGSSLGSGRVVAFSGQDFLGSSERATLVGHEHVSRVLANAVRWTARDSRPPLRILADNQRIAEALKVHGLEAVKVVGRGAGRTGPRLECQRVERCGRCRGPDQRMGCGTFGWRIRHSTAGVCRARRGTRHRRLGPPLELVDRATSRAVHRQRSPARHRHLVERGQHLRDRLRDHEDRSACADPRHHMGGVPRGTAT